MYNEDVGLGNLSMLHTFQYCMTSPFCHSYHQHCNEIIGDEDDMRREVRHGDASSIHSAKSISYYDVEECILKLLRELDTCRKATLQMEHSILSIFNLNICKQTQ